MSSPTRFVWRSLTAVLLSIAVAWVPTAFSVSYAVSGDSITLGPSQGPPETSVHVTFPVCSHEDSDITQVTWDTGAVLSHGADFTVPHDAKPGGHSVTAQCSNDAVGDGSTTFTVTPADSGDNGGTTPVYDPVLTLDPTEGASGTTVTATGSGFNCSSVDVVWDVGGAHTTLTGTDVLSAGTFATKFTVPTDSAETTYTVRAECAQEPYASDDADFTVTGTATDGTTTGGGNGGGTTGETTDGTTGDTTGGTTGGNTGGDTGGTTGDTSGGTTSNGGTTGGTDGGTDGGTTGGTDGGTTSGNTGGNTGGTHSGGTTPIGLVIGPSAFAAVLLLAGLLALSNHRHRGPRWVRDHVRTTLRPGAGKADLHEQRDTRSPNRTVRLEPHTDPGEQNLH